LFVKLISELFLQLFCLIGPLLNSLLSSKLKFNKKSTHEFDGMQARDGGQVALVAHQHSPGLPVVLGQPRPLGVGEEAAELEADLQRSSVVQIVGHPFLQMD
jgi:hypothetical protein